MVVLGGGAVSYERGTCVLVKNPVMKIPSPEIGNFQLGSERGVLRWRWVLRGWSALTSPSR